MLITKISCALLYSHSALAGHAYRSYNIRYFSVCRATVYESHKANNLSNCYRGTVLITCFERVQSSNNLFSSRNLVLDKWLTEKEVRKMGNASPTVVCDFMHTACSRNMVSPITIKCLNILLRPIKCTITVENSTTVECANCLKKIAKTQ